MLPHVQSLRIYLVLPFETEATWDFFLSTAVNDMTLLSSAQRTSANMFDMSFANAAVQKQTVKIHHSKQDQEDNGELSVGQQAAAYQDGYMEPPCEVSFYVWIRHPANDPDLLSTLAGDHLDKCQLDCGEAVCFTMEEEGFNRGPPCQNGMTAAKEAKRTSILYRCQHQKALLQ